MAKKNEGEAQQSRREKAPKRARLQNFEARDVLRSQIKPDPENPRFMDASGRVGLRGVLEEYGLVDTVTWNEATGELAGGHQRLGILDASENYYEERDDQGNITLVENDYILTVAVISVTHERQREINLALNNQDIMGMYDLDMMAAWIVSGNINPFKAGFTEASLEDQLGPDVLILVLDAFKPQETLDAEEQKVATEQASNPVAVEGVKDEISLIKERRGAWLEKSRAGNDPDHMLTLVFTDSGQRGEFLTALEFDPGKRFLPLDTFLDHFDRFAAKYAFGQAVDATLDPERVAVALDLRQPADFMTYFAAAIKSSIDAGGHSLVTLQLPQETTDAPDPEPDTTPEA